MRSNQSGIGTLYVGFCVGWKNPRWVSVGTKTMGAASKMGIGDKRMETVDW
jgi:hypothetical protein